MGPKPVREGLLQVASLLVGAGKTLVRLRFLEAVTDFTSERERSFVVFEHLIKCLFGHAVGESGRVPEPVQRGSRQTPIPGADPDFQCVAVARFGFVRTT